ncbi:hypothetical protein EV180_004530 [Coemansia sp. RSA 518]|nr:hypothetical protein EV180_004530 [Coemansia sp. RSA 518]KAJ2271877.1 hypothetical protein GGH14_004805 [Coemansia sp. RSA 370]
MSAEPEAKAAEANQPHAETPKGFLPEAPEKPLDIDHKTQPGKTVTPASSAADALANVPAAAESVPTEPVPRTMSESEYGLKVVPESEPKNTSESAARSISLPGPESAAKAVQQPQPESSDMGPEAAERSLSSIADALAAKAPPVETAEDDDEVCAICNQGDYTPDNLIVFCEGKCKMSFHQSCYGIPEIPPGDEPWYCDLCSCGTGANQFRKNLYCCHYKSDRAARSLVIEDRPSEYHFVHVHCAAFIPFVDTSHIPFTTDVPKVKAEKTKCCFCAARYGYQVHCSHKEHNIACETTFHPMCAIRYKFLSGPTLYSTKYHHLLCPDHSPPSDSNDTIPGTAKRRRAAVTTEHDELPDKIGRRQSQPFQSPHVKDAVVTPARRGRPPLNRSSPTSANSRGRSGKRVGRPPGRRGRPPLRNRGVSRAERELNIVQDDESELSQNEAATPLPATRRRGRGRPRYIDSTDENEETTDRYTNGSMSMSARTESSEMVVANGQVPMLRGVHTTSPGIMHNNRPHAAMSSLDNLAMAAHNTLYDNSNGNGSRDRRITLTFNGQQGYRGGSANAAINDNGPISPAYLNQHRHSLNSMSPSHPQPVMYNYNDQSRMPPPKRPSIRVRPFAHPSNPPVMSRGSIPHAQMPSPRSYGVDAAGSAGIYDHSPQSPVPARLSPEQDRILKESHDMLQKQADSLKAIQDAIKELSAHPTRQAQNAMSTISSLSALISGNNAQTTPPMAQQNGAAFQFKQTPSTVGSLGAVSSSILTTELPRASTSSPVVAPAVAAAVQLPKPALGAQQLHRYGPISVQPGLLIQPGLSAQTSQQQPTGDAKSTADPKRDSDAEMDELKDNVIFLLKRVNMPQILLNMLTTKAEGGSEGRGQAFTALVADLKRLGALSKGNLQDYLRVFVRNLENSDHS